MFQMLIKRILIAATMLPMIANSQINDTYLPPIFIDSKRFEKIQTTFPVINTMYQEYAKENHFPGYVFAIILDGRVVYFGQGGYANIEEKIPANPQTMFRIASMTKSFTAMAILKLRDEGKLKLDDPVSLYIPEMKNQKLTADSPEITIRNLLTHSAGFPTDDPWGDRNLNQSDEELMAFIKNGISFANAPGTHFEYSNLGFALLGLVIKQVSGMPYQNYIANTIWNPLGMKATWEFATIPANQLAQGYKWNNGQWLKEELLHDGSFGAMGGMITSVESFSHYLALHQAAWPERDDAETGLIKRSSIREMHQAWRFNMLNTQSIVNGEQCATISAYGYGLRWVHDCQNKTYVGHSGGLPGFGSNWLILPEYGIGVIFFANVTYAAAERINLQVLNKLIEKEQLKPRQLPPTAVLNERKKALLKLLPEWTDAKNSTIFAKNFFLDSSVDSLKEKTRGLFAKAGPIKQIEALVPVTQLSGYFIIKGERANLKISLALSPENPALIQSYQIEESL